MYRKHCSWNNKFTTVIVWKSSYSYKAKFIIYRLIIDFLMPNQPWWVDFLMPNHLIQNTHNMKHEKQKNNTIKQLSCTDIDISEHQQINHLWKKTEVPWLLLLQQAGSLGSNGSKERATFTSLRHARDGQQRVVSLHQVGLQHQDIEKACC